MDDKDKNYYKGMDAKVSDSLIARHGYVTVDIRRSYAGWGSITIRADEVWHHERNETEQGLQDAYVKSKGTGASTFHDGIYIPFAYYDNTLSEPLNAELRHREDGEPRCLRGALSLWCDGEEDGINTIRVSDARVRIACPYNNREDTVIAIRDDGGSYRDDICECVGQLYDAMMRGEFDPTHLWQFVGDDIEDDADGKTPSLDPHDYEWKQDFPTDDVAFSGYAALDAETDD